MKLQLVGDGDQEPTVNKRFAPNEGLHGQLFIHHNHIVTHSCFQAGFALPCRPHGNQKPAAVTQTTRSQYSKVTMHRMCVCERV